MTYGFLCPPRRRLGWKEHRNSLASDFQHQLPWILGCPWWRYSCVLFVFNVYCSNKGWGTLVNMSSSHVRPNRMKKIWLQGNEVGRKDGTGLCSKMLDQYDAGLKITIHWVAEQVWCRGCITHQWRLQIGFNVTDISGSRSLGWSPHSSLESYC